MNDQSRAADLPEKEFPQRLQELRAALEMSQRKLAFLLDVPQSTVYRWETGKVRPGFDYLEKLFRLASQHGALAKLFPSQDFDSVFLFSEVWRATSTQYQKVHFFKITAHDVPGSTASILTLIAEHGGNLIRIAGYEKAHADLSVLRLLIEFPPEVRAQTVKRVLMQLDHVVEIERQSQ